MTWTVERADLTGGRSTYLVVDDVTFELQPHVLEYVQALSLSGRSPNTVRTYVRPIARFLNWCNDRGVDWTRVTLLTMARFRHDIEVTPLRTGELPAASTVSVALTGVMEFLRYCAAAGHIADEVPARLVERRWVHHSPTNAGGGEGGQYRRVRVNALRVRLEEHPPTVLSEQQSAETAQSASTARDRFLLLLMLVAGLRIGEALGLRSEDMHFLPSSAALGCAISGPHVHVRKRRDNVNNTRAKSARARAVPVTNDVIQHYRDYRYERDRQLGVAHINPYVFVNYNGSRTGEAMTYSNAYQLIRRLGKLHGFRVTPHMYRHTAATTWVESGTEVDVVKELLGHASTTSTHVYLHPSRERMREAVQNATRGRHG